MGSDPTHLQTLRGWENTRIWYPMPVSQGLPQSVDEPSDHCGYEHKSNYAKELRVHHSQDVGRLRWGEAKTSARFGEPQNV